MRSGVPVITVRALSVLRFFVMIGTVSCQEWDDLAELRRLEERLAHTERRVNVRNIGNFVFRNKLNTVQEKIGEYQDDDRRMLMQINGLPYIEQEHLYQVLEQVAQILNISISDEEITLLLTMAAPTDEVLKKTGKRVHPILLGVKTRKIKWKWMGALRNYIHKCKPDYKQFGLTITFRHKNEELTYSGVTLHEHLSPQKRKLFKKVKKMCTEMDFADMWFNDTQIYVKRRYYNNPFIVKNEDDMHFKITRPHWSHDRVLQYRHGFHMNQDHHDRDERL